MAQVEQQMPSVFRDSDGSTNDTPWQKEQHTLKQQNATSIPDA
jgi:hypothetical protein